MKDKKYRDYLTWDDTFMLMSDLISKRSKDPSTRVGACIVNDDNIIVGLGYNGFPKNCEEDSFPWKRQAEDYLDTKYPYVVHAEANAIMNSSIKLSNCRIYVNLFPCNECAKLIVQSGIKEVVYNSDKYADLDMTIASKKILKAAGVTFRQYTPTKKIKITANVENKTS